MNETTNIYLQEQEQSLLHFKQLGVGNNVPPSIQYTLAVILLVAPKVVGLVLFHLLPNQVLQWSAVQISMKVVYIASKKS